MGISDTHHFNWLRKSLQPLGRAIGSQKERPRLLGLGEHAPNPLVESLFPGKTFDYLAADAFPKNESVFKVDLNDLSPLFSQGQFDFITCFRSSFFIEDKHRFLEQVSRLLVPGGHIAVDFLIGNSTYPVIEWDNDAVYDGAACPFKSTFYDDRLIKEFRKDAEKFCRHVRTWPLSKDWPLHLRLPLLFKDIPRWKSSRKWKALRPEGLGQAIQQGFQERNRFSLVDFQMIGLDIVAYHAKYFYPEIEKFNLFNLVLARKASPKG